MGKRKTTKRSTKKSVNKSAAIRQYLARRPTAGPKEVQQALGKKGIDVTEALVSNIKYKLKLTDSSSGRGRTRQPQPSDDIKQAGRLMFQAVDLVVRAGAQEARQLVDVATDMVKRIGNDK